MIDHITDVSVAVARGRLPAVLAVRRPEDLRGRRRGRVDRQRAAAGGGIHGRVIVAMGGASLRPEDYDPRLNDFVLSLARRGRPRVCFVPTASGDSPDYVANFYRAFSGHHDCEPSDLGLFERTVADLRGFVLAQDVIWVGGGNTASLLAVWRMHGLDVVLREAWEQGVRAVRRERGDELLVRGLDDRLVRPVRSSRRWRTASVCCRAAAARTTTARSSGARCYTRLVAEGELPAGLRGRRRGGAGVRGDLVARGGARRAAGLDRVPGRPRTARPLWPPGCSRCPALGLGERG